MTENQSPQAPKSTGPEMDKKQLLLLGLNLLNKGLKLPYAVVRPQAKPSAPRPASELTEKLKSSLSTPTSPLKSQVTVELDGSRKRKRDSTDDLSEVEKREKRFVFFKTAPNYQQMLIECAILFCRKMMNRVSAQNARDRKKAYVEDLERKVALLEEKVCKLNILWLIGKKK